MEIKIIIADVKNKTTKEIINHYKEYIKDEDLKRMDAFKFDQGKKQFLMSSILKAKYVKGDIYYNEHKKPLSKDIFFNISHSCDYVVMALSDKYYVGIDIEYIKDNVKDRLISYVCSDEEIKDINNNDKNKMFYYYWTRKEAVLKCEGVGIVKDLKSVLVNNKYYLVSNYIDDYVWSLAVDCNNEEKVEINCIIEE